MKVNKDKAEKYILYLPQWYPSRKDPQLGIFIRKHASSASLHMKVVVLYATGIDKLHNEYECSLSSKGNLTELIVYFRIQAEFFEICSIFKIHKAFRRYDNIINENSEPACSIQCSLQPLAPLSRSTIYHMCNNIGQRLSMVPTSERHVYKFLQNCEKTRALLAVSQPLTR